jgi:hypothetical protein
MLNSYTHKPLKDMKTLILCCLFFLPITASAQIFPDQITVRRVQSLDSSIAGLERTSTNVASVPQFKEKFTETVKGKKEQRPATVLPDSLSNTSFTRQSVLQYADTTSKDSTERLIKILKLHEPFQNKEQLAYYINLIRNFETIVQLYEVYQESVAKIVKCHQRPDSLFIQEKLQYLELVKSQYEFLESQIYSLYRNSDFSKQWFKGFMFYHDNDFLLVGPFKKMNRDRDYTGGARLEVLTDQFKLRFFSDIFHQLGSVNSKLLFNNEYILSYQGFFYGVEAYTPYIRFGSDSTLAPKGESQLMEMSYDIDRPFASFQYFGRSKYYLHYTGAWRAKLDTRIGWIGKDAGRKVQDVLHRDITLASVHVNRWEDQIGNGGRLAFNLDYNLDVTLFSRDGDLFNPLRQFDSSDSARVKYGRKRVNIYMPVTLQYGNVISAGAVGLGFSNRSFKDRGGNYGFIYPESRFVKSSSSLKNWIRRTFYYSVESRLKYVVHNSLIQGVGIFRTLESDQDGTDDEFLSKRKLIPYDGTDPSLNFNPKDGEMNKWVWSIDIALSVKLRKSTLFFAQSFNTREYRYNKQAVDAVVNFANSNVPGQNFTWNNYRDFVDSKEQYAVNQIDRKLYNSRIRGFGRLGFLFEF